jgi:replicative DNA helicase
MAIQNEAAERALAGALLLDAKYAAREVHRAGLDPDMLYTHKWRVLVSAALALVAAGQPVDEVTVLDELERQGQLAIAGVPEIVEAIGGCASYANAGEYAAVVMDRAKRRQGVKIASALAKYAHDMGEAWDPVAARASRALVSQVRSGEHVTLREAMGEFWDDVAHWTTHPLTGTDVRGLSTGLIDLDWMTGGLETGLYVIGAATGTGKTALSLSVALNVARQYGHVVYFTLEMTTKQLVERLACMVSGVRRRDLRRGNVSSEAYDRLQQAMGELTELPLEIYAEAQTMSAIRATLLGGEQPDFVVVDWMGLVGGATTDKTYEALGEVARWALQLAQDPDIDCPVWVPHQISKKLLSHRKDKRPEPGDLYSSDEPNMSTDVLLLLHRQDLWDLDAEKGVLEIALWKDRLNGEPERAREFYISPAALVSNLVREEGVNDHVYRG